MSCFNLFKSFQDSRYFLVQWLELLQSKCIKQNYALLEAVRSRWTRGRRLVPSPTAPFLAFFFLRRPKHGQQSQVTIFGRLGSFGGSYPYRACLLKTHPVPTYTGP
ncbi:hypothetical protein NC653_017011 [Populus alba x Populus x berolinensis]|uniref:Uncharacterized protein n=1 Tax=Populus alba x Populus x berolinensis TaxID=444605 RepID=A0AAD6QP85_9ROSI|nr:hypothetical protein NC653_017011 [Populus alba x Populus x berolinensis]